MICFFLEMPLSKHLEKKFSTQEFLQDISYKLTRNKIHKTAIEDIFDGSNYLDQQFRSEYGNLSLGFFLDGMSVFSSSNWQMWPLLYMIHDLPIEKRFEYVAIAGLWFGRSKPDVNLFLMPLLSSLKSSPIKNTHLSAVMALSENLLFRR
eukprot:Pompholyxophrys_punicea_v1_NODE_459_length_1911_cov_26.718211.p1 type:complete len:150 gc:universal NODE_459_length_1911_cov_26.718211:1611-1162(-)